MRGERNLSVALLPLHKSVDVTRTGAAGGTNAKEEKVTVNMETKTNVVLVHGAWADGSSWSRVIPLLQKKGLNVVAVQLPFTSIDADVAVTKNLLFALGSPVVLVGHSYGEVVISGAANGMPNVKALVYIAAFALDEGESIEGLGKQGPAPAGAAAVRPPDDRMHSSSCTPIRVTEPSITRNVVLRAREVILEQVRLTEKLPGPPRNSYEQ